MSYQNLSGVLHNFLGTFTSRYSDLNGYWLFGFLVMEFTQMEFDLLQTNFDEEESMSIFTAKKLASTKFVEQLQKSGLDLLIVQSARLQISVSPNHEQGFINGKLCFGHNMQFVAEAATNLNKVHHIKKYLFVAPHNPQIESRSARAV